MASASTGSVHAAADRVLTRSQAEAAIAQRLQVLGHPAGLLDRPAVASLVGFARGSERQLRADLAAVLFVASTEDAPTVDVALVRRALQTGLREDELGAAPRGWKLAWRRALASVTPRRRTAAQSDIWRDDFRLSLAAACIAALASILFVIYARTTHGGLTARPVWGDRFVPSVAQLRLTPAAPMRPPAPRMAASGARSVTQGAQRLAAANLVPDHAEPAVAPSAPSSRQPAGQAGQDGGAHVQPLGANTPAAPSSAAVQPAASDEPNAVPPTQAEMAGLRQLQANASSGGAPHAQPHQPDAQAGPARLPQTAAATPAAPPGQTPATRLAEADVPSHAPATPAAATPASAPPAPASPLAGTPDTAAPPIKPGSAAPPSADSAPAAPAAAAPASAAPDANKLAALQTLSPPVSVPSLPVPPSSVESPNLTDSGRLRTAAPASILLLYPDRDAEALRRLRPLAIRLQQEGITNIRARPTRALPARRAISYFYTDDEPLAHVIAQTLAEADWPQLKGNSLQPSLVLVPPGLHPRRPGTIEIQLP